MRTLLMLAIGAGHASPRSRRPQITSQDLLDGLKDPTRWLTYSGDYNGQRHSPLTQITPENVDQLDGAVDVPDRHARQLPDDADRDRRRALRHRLQQQRVGDRRAIRAADLALSPRSAGRSASCAAARSTAASRVLGDRLFMTTLDAHLVALDMRTGDVLYDVELADYKEGYSATVAPLVVKDKVIVGIAGAEYGIRGFIDAYDAQTGKRAWRFYTVPARASPAGAPGRRGDAYKRGGGSIWVTGTYDPQQNLVFFGTGNPGPDYYSSAREGDNLYTASLVALDADTGETRAGTISSRRTTCTTGIRRRCRCSAT